MEKTIGAIKTGGNLIRAVQEARYTDLPLRMRIVVPHGLKLTDAQGREIKSFSVKQKTNNGEEVGFNMHIIDDFSNSSQTFMSIGACFEFSKPEDIEYCDPPEVIDLGDKSIQPLVDFDRSGPVETVNIMDPNSLKTIIKYSLIRTLGRLTFDIHEQDDDHRYWGPDDGIFWRFQASNGYEVISRSRMDIETDRIWILGGATDGRSQRSGTMPVSSEETLTKMIPAYHKALHDWARFRLALKYNQGTK
jgi:hypothetical protein